MEYYLKVWKNYINFSGRARRTEYWMFVLFNVLASIMLVGIDVAIGIIFGLDYFLFFYPLYAFAVFLPAFAVTVRRLHDTGVSGWMLLLGLIPFAGGIILLVFYLLDSQEGANRFGPNPKAKVA